MSLESEVVGSHGPGRVYQKMLASSQAFKMQGGRSRGLERCGNNHRLSVWSMLDESMMASFRLINIHSMAMIGKEYGISVKLIVSL